MEKKTIIYAKKKAGIDKNPTREIGDITLRDGSTVRIYRVQDINAVDGVLYGEIVAMQNGGEVGKCVYSFPGTENSRLLGIVVEKDKRGVGIGSALLNSLVIDAIVCQRRKSVLARSDYNAYIAKFMEKNHFKVMSNYGNSEVNYSIYANDEVRMAKVIEQQKNPARLKDEELYY